MPPKTEADTHVGVRVKCPHCGATGKVDMSRLGETFTCGQCEKKFHVDVKETRKGTRDKTKEHDHATLKLDLDQPSVVGKYWMRIPRSLKIAVIAGIGLFGVWSLVGDLLIPKATLPEGLDERAALAVKSMVERDVSTIKRLSYKSNNVECGEWIKKMRPVTWPKAFPKDRPPPIKTLVTSNARQKDPQKSGLQATASVVVIVDMPEYKTEPRREFATYWVQTANDYAWFMDVRRSSAK